MESWPSRLRCRSRACAWSRQDHADAVVLDLGARSTTAARRARPADGARSFERRRARVGRPPPGRCRAPARGEDPATACHAPGGRRRRGDGAEPAGDRAPGRRGGRARGVGGRDAPAGPHRARRPGRRRTSAGAGAPHHRPGDRERGRRRPGLAGHARGRGGLGRSRSPRCRSWSCRWPGGHRSGSERLTGASEVRDDVRQAVIRATLDAVNRRLALRPRPPMTRRVRPLPPRPLDDLLAAPARAVAARGRRARATAPSPCARRRPPDPGHREPALFVHGLGGNATNWTDLMALLRDRLDGCRPSICPGFGWSPPPRDGDYSPRRNAESLAELVETRFDGRPVHLFGNSMGGAIAVQLAARRPRPRPHADPREPRAAQDRRAPDATCTCP